MNLLTVLPFHIDTAPQAETLLDWIFELSGKEQKGHILLVSSNDTHAEMREKIKLSAELAFETVDLIVVNPHEALPQSPSKAELINAMFRVASGHVSDTYKLPFLWLEPDCVPLVPGWLERIEDAYEAQPKNYLGAILTDGTEKTFLARTSVYPSNCGAFLQPFLGGLSPFELMAGSDLSSKATKSRLFQFIKFTDQTQVSKLREDAVLAHHDKTGLLLTLLRDKLRTKPRRGRPPKVLATA